MQPICQTEQIDGILFAKIFNSSSPKCNLILFRHSIVDTIIIFFLYLDDYEYADYTASNSYAASARIQDEYMMSSNLQPNFLSYEVDLDTDLLALESADYGSEAVEVPAPDYMVDWDTLFGASSSSSSSSSFYPSANRFSSFHK